MQGHQLIRWGALLRCAVLALLVAEVVMGTSCGSGTPTTTSSASAAISPTASATEATPTAAPSTPAEVADAYCRALDDYQNGSLIALYADDAYLEDRGQGRICRGVEEIQAYQDEWYNALAMESRSRFSCSEGAIVEEKGQASGSATYAMEVLLVRDGKITTDYVYFSDWLSDRVPKVAPALLKTAPAASDTRAVSGSVARDYMSALRALSPTRLASLYANDVVYQDTSRDIRYRGPDAVLSEHEKMFGLKGVRFKAAGGLEGAGWAVVLWRRSDREGGSVPSGYPLEFAQWALRPTVCGASVLEIRDGKIARETIYCDHLRTRY